MAPPAPQRKIFWVRVLCQRKTAMEETAKLLREIKGVTSTKLLKDQLIQVVMEGEAKMLEGEMKKKHRLVKVEREELAPPLPPPRPAAPPPPPFTIYRVSTCCGEEECMKKLAKWVKSVGGQIQNKTKLCSEKTYFFAKWQGWVPPEKIQNWIVASNIEVEVVQEVPPLPPPPKPEPKPEPKPAQDKVTCLPEAQLQGGYGSAPTPSWPSTLHEPFYYGFNDENVNACNVM